MSTCTATIKVYMYLSYRSCYYFLTVVYVYVCMYMCTLYVWVDVGLFVCVDLIEVSLSPIVEKTGREATPRRGGEPIYKRR